MLKSQAVTTTKIETGPHLNENFRASKHTINKVKRQPRDGRENLQIIHQIRILYLENKRDSYNSIIKRKVIQFLKWTKTLNIHFSEEDTQMANKHMKKIFNIISHQENGNQMMQLIRAEFPKHTNSSYNSNKQTKKPNTIKKWAEELNSHFSNEDIDMANRHTRRCSSSLIIRQMQIRTTRYHFTLVRMTIIKKSKNNKS